MKSRNKIKIPGLISLIIAFSMGCTKLTQVPQPVNTITTDEIFSSDATATSAIIGIYNDLGRGYGSGGFGFGNGATSCYPGMSADELHQSGGVSNYENNTLNASIANSIFWIEPYYDIYIANATINALPTASAIDATTKKQLMGEAQFFRAFCYFYLVNLYGAVPLATTTNYHITDTLRRSSVASIYQLIISDLKSAQAELPADYSVSGGQRVRVNQYGATALLARAYLFMGDYKDAITQSTAVIGNTSLYSLTNLNSVFLANSAEAILQVEPSNTYPFAPLEGDNFLPVPGGGAPPPYFLTTQLLNAFEPGDQRLTLWTDTTTYSGTLYYYPYKYTVYTGQQGNITQYCMVLRLAEQYLIRAEAEANGYGNGLSGAISDLNIIRARAGLSALSSGLNSSQVIAAVAQERRIELFCEWGHRWLDLKRTGQAHNVLSVLNYKQPWPGDYQFLYPIPATEVIDDANLVQNPGY